MDYLKKLWNGWADDGLKEIDHARIREATEIYIKPAPVLDISEPVVKLLAMLDECHWEVLPIEVQFVDVEGFKGVCRKEIFSLASTKCVGLTLKVCRADCYNGIPTQMCDMPWLTDDERAALIFKVTRKIEAIEKAKAGLKNNQAREEYKKKLESYEVS